MKRTSIRTKGILLTMVDFRTNYAKDITQMLRESYGKTIGIMDTCIPFSVRAPEASAAGISIYKYDPNCKVAKCYEQLTKEAIQMTFDFYIGPQAEQFSFIRIPKLLLLSPEFQDLSIQAKMLYAVLLDRMSLSVKNHWMDEQNSVYIIYQVKEIVQDLGFTKRKAMDVLTELEQFGLVARKRRGRGLPNYLYVKNFLSGLTAFQSTGKGQVRNAHPSTSSTAH